MIRTQTLWRHFEGRRIRHPFLRAMFALIGVTLLSALLVLGIAVGLTMILCGLLRRALTRRPAAAQAGTVIDGEYRVVRNTKPSLAR